MHEQSSTENRCVAFFTGQQRSGVTTPSCPFNSVNETLDELIGRILGDALPVVFISPVPLAQPRLP